MKGKWCTASIIMNILKTVLPSIKSDLEKDLAERFGTICTISGTAGSQGHAAGSEERRVEMGAVPRQTAGL